MSTSQREIIDKQQLSNDAQQRDISSCVVSLGKMNPAVRALITVIAVPIGATDYKNRRIDSYTLLRAGYMYELFVITNVPEPKFRGRLKCPIAFAMLGGPQIHTSSMSVLLPQMPPYPISDNEYHITVDASGTEWNASHPAYMTVTTKDAHLGGCTFTPTE